jgi:hypothetical protein
MGWVISAKKKKEREGQFPMERMRRERGRKRTVVRHRQNRDLSDRTVPPLNTTRTLVNRRQIRVHVTGVSTTTGNLLTRRRDLTKSVGVGGHVGEDDEDVLLELVGEVFGGGEGKTGGDDTLDAVKAGVDQQEQEEESVEEKETNVGSLAKLRKRETRSREPFSSKSCLKKRAVSMLTPIAAKTIEKLSSCPS